MNLADIKKKIAAGENLTDAEKKFLTEYDEEKVKSDAAAAARRKAEEKAAQLEKEKTDLQEQMKQVQAKLDQQANAGKSDVEKAQAQIESLSKQVSDLNGKLEDANKAQATMARQGKLSEIRRKNGIQFVDGMDHDMLARSFENAFDGIDDTQLDNEDVIKTKLETWRAMNKAAIVDNSGGPGSGGAPHVGGGAGGGAEKVVMSEDDILKAAQSGDIEEAEKQLDAAQKAEDAGTLELN